MWFLQPLILPSASMQFATRVRTWRVARLYSEIAVSRKPFGIGHWRFAQHCYAWFPSYYFCAGLMFLDQFHCRCLAVNRGCSAFCLYQRRATFSGPVFVVGNYIRGRNPSKTSAQYGNSVLPQRSIYDRLKN
jgi:hypothetical protein